MTREEYITTLGNTPEEIELANELAGLDTWEEGD